MDTAPPAASTPAGFAALFDHTLLTPGATPAAIETLCAEASRHGFAAVCVNGVNVARCRELLVGSQVRVCSVVGFPLGGNAHQVKVYEATLALEDGAQELDMVLDIGALLAGETQRVAQDIHGVVERALRRRALVKVILETGLLTRDQVVLACRVSEDAGAHFVKTSTGFGPRGASCEDVALMRASVSPRMGIKAAGAVRTAGFARELLSAGATRLGSSASVGIVLEAGLHGAAE